MEKVQYLTRRRFLGLASAALAAATMPGVDFLRKAWPAHAEGPAPRHQYLPYIGCNHPTPRVIHVHHPSASNWDFSESYYGNYVNQANVNLMVDEGLKLLTKTSTVANAWRALLPDYLPGKIFAIKANFNNCLDCSDDDTIIDALIHPINSLIRSLQQMDAGFQPAQMWVFDAARTIPTRFQNGLRPENAGVRFYGRSGSCVLRATYDSSDPSTIVTFNKGGIAVRKLPDVLVNADYLINMPIMKDHGAAGVTLGFKNHFGTIDRIDDLHNYLHPDDTSNYSCLVDIYLNSNIRDKTVLTLGDGIFGGLGGQAATPRRWPQTFANKSPNSLFFSRDPVAIDCVMVDILRSEPGPHPALPGDVRNYLRLAAAAGLGTYEQGDPWGSGYSQIDYIYQSL